MVTKEAKRKRAILQGNKNDIHLYVRDSRSMVSYLTRQKKSFFQNRIRQLRFYEDKDHWVRQLNFYDETKPAIIVIYLYIQMVLVGQEAAESRETAHKWMHDANITSREYDMQMADLECDESGDEEETADLEDGELELDNIIAQEAQRVWKYVLYAYFTLNKVWTKQFTKACVSPLNLCLTNSPKENAQKVVKDLGLVEEKLDYRTKRTMNIIRIQHSFLLEYRNKLTVIVVSGLRWRIGQDPEEAHYDTKSMVIPADLNLIVFQELTTIALYSCQDDEDRHLGDMTIPFQGKLRDVLVALNDFHSQHPRFWHGGEDFSGFRYSPYGCRLDFACDRNKSRH